MQTTTQSPALRFTALKYGLTFGLLAGAISIIIIVLDSFSQFTANLAFDLSRSGSISPDVALSLLEYSLIGITLLISTILCGIAGNMAAKQTGLAKTGIAAGAYSGLIFALLDAISNLLILLGITFPEISQGPAQGVAVMKTQLLTNDLVTSLIVLALAVVLGVAAGTLGGRIGQKQSAILPADYATNPPPDDPPC